MTERANVVLNMFEHVEHPGTRNAFRTEIDILQPSADHLLETPA